MIWPRGYETFFMLNSAEYIEILLINVKMPTIVGILTFISMINTSEKLKARNFFICQYFSYYEQLKFGSVELSMKNVLYPWGLTHF